MARQPKIHRERKIPPRESLNSAGRSIYGFGRMLAFSILRVAVKSFPQERLIRQATQLAPLTERFFFNAGFASGQCGFRGDSS
jgi:hypothetical protein